MNRITIIGNLTRDPETGTTDGGINWCRFSVAVNGRKRGDSPAPVEYFEVTAWRALAGKKGKKWPLRGSRGAPPGSGGMGTRRGGLK